MLHHHPSIKFKKCKYRQAYRPVVCKNMKIACIYSSTSKYTLTPHPVFLSLLLEAHVPTFTTKYTAHVPTFTIHFATA